MSRGIVELSKKSMKLPKGKCQLQFQAYKGHFLRLYGDFMKRGNILASFSTRKKIEKRYVFILVLG